MRSSRHVRRAAAALAGAGIAGGALLATPSAQAADSTWTLGPRPSPVCLQSGGEGTSYIAAATLTGSWSSDLTATMTNLPAGITTDPETIGAGTSANTVVIVYHYNYQGTTVTDGTYTSTVTATDGTETQTVPVTWDIQDSC